jgi:hypothetical protein
MKYLGQKLTVSIAAAILGTVLFLGIGAAYCAAVHHFGSGPLGATGVFVTTISKQPYQLPASVYFQSLSKSFTSSSESLLEQNVNASTAGSAMVGASGGTPQMVYFYSSALDGTLALYPNTAGTGSIVSGGSTAITAGIPYEWDYLLSGTTNSLALTSTNSLVFTAGSLASGGTTSVTSTTITAAALYP